MSPPLSKTQDKASLEKKESVAFVVRRLMEEGYEFICLSELSAKDIDFLVEQTKSNSYGYYCARGAEKNENLYFDTGIFYKKHNVLERSNYKDSVNYIYVKGRSRVKFGQKYKFRLSINEDIILFLSHWPSRIRNEEEKRDDIATRLRINIENGFNETSKIIVLGDFNVEPYHNTIIHKLQSSRAKGVVLKNEMTLYNPCWKFMCSDQILGGAQTLGTHFYPKADLFHEWHILDQVLISKDFLLPTWSFKDESVTILEQKKLIDGIDFEYNASDHQLLSLIIGRAL